MAVRSTPMRFTRATADAVIDRMEELAERGDGKSWVNVHPDLDEHEAPPESPLTSLFSAKGPQVPAGTWVPGRIKGAKVEPTSVGLQHPAGRKAVEQLAELNVTVPESWRLQQDHAKRGLTFLVPHDEDPAVALRFMVNAATALSDVWLEDRWVAVVAEQVRRSER